MVVEANWVVPNSKEGKRERTNFREALSTIQFFYYLLQKPLHYRGIRMNPLLQAKLIISP
jgi:hypothetical protein